MKRSCTITLIIVLSAILCGCLPQASLTPGAGSASPRPAVTGIGAQGTVSPAATANPTTMRTAQSTSGSVPGQSVQEKAMLRDIGFLISRSEYQQGQETNYKNLKKEQLITVKSVTDKVLIFDGKTQVFSGDYTGQFTAGRSYQYFEDASSGGKRYYNVKDNFGVWIIFMYTVPF